MDKFVEPWEYFVVENVMPDSAFYELQQELNALKKPDAGERKRYYLCGRDSPRYVRGHEIKINDKLHNYLKTYIHTVLIELASWTFPNLDLNSTFCYDECSIQSKNHKYPIHCDIPYKIVSSVFHVSDEGVGTHLYDKNEKYHSTLPWTTNSCMFFANAPYKLHSFTSDVDYRITISSSLRAT